MFKLAIHWDDFRMDLAAAFGEFIGTVRSLVTSVEILV